MIGKIAFDCELMRPGCVLLQAALGGDHSFSHEFPTDSWLLSPTENLKLYPVESKEFLSKLVMMTKKRMQDNRHAT